MRRILKTIEPYCNLFNSMIIPLILLLNIVPINGVVKNVVSVI